jgi:hypothetical protein
MTCLSAISGAMAESSFGEGFGDVLAGARRTGGVVRPSVRKSSIGETDRRNLLPKRPRARGRDRGDRRFGFCIGQADTLRRLWRGTCFIVALHRLSLEETDRSRDGLLDRARSRASRPERWRSEQCIITVSDRARRRNHARFPWEPSVRLRSIPWRLIRHARGGLPQWNSASCLARFPTLTLPPIDNAPRLAQFGAAFPMMECRKPQVPAPRAIRSERRELSPGANTALKASLNAIETSA